MEGKRPGAVNAVNGHLLQEPPAPGATIPPKVGPKRKKGKEKNKVLLSIRREMHTIHLCQHEGSGINPFSLISC